MKYYIIGLFFTLFLTTSFASEELTTIQVNHRPAEQILEEIHDFLPQTAVARAYNQMIILKAPPATIREMSTLIEMLDKPLTAITVTVMRSYESLSTLNNNELNIKLGQNTSQVKLKSWSTNDADQQSSHFKVQGITGHKMLIQLDKELPQQENIVFFNQNADVSAVATNTRYINIKNGFQAITHLLPDNKANITILPIFSSLSHQDSSINQSSAATVIHCDIGQWVELGQLGQNQTFDENSSRTYSTHKAQNEYIYLKIDTTH
jgi:hypothetical protein